MTRRIGDSVENGRLRYVSASAIQTFDPGTFGGCPTKWWYAYVQGKREKETDAQTTGKIVHAQIEAYLKGGGENTLGDVARSGFRFLPKPGPDLLIEQGFVEIFHRDGAVWADKFDQFADVDDSPHSPLVAAGIPVIGFADLVQAREKWVDDDGVLQDATDHVEIEDWKSTTRIEDDLYPDGSVRRMGLAKSPEAMANTWQMISYGELARLAYAWATHVRLSHGYFQTQGARYAKKVSTLVSVEEIARRWEKVFPIVRAMGGCASEVDPKKIDKNYAACDAYRGCMHRDYCPRDPDKVFAIGLRRSKPVAPPAPAPIVGDDSHALADPPERTTTMETKSVLPPEARKAGPLELPNVELYLDCIPDGGKGERLEDYAVRIASAILELAPDAADVRCAPTDSPLGFAKWKGAMSAAALKAPPAPGVYFCASGDELGKLVFDALAPAVRRGGGKVVRGISR